MTSRDDKSRQHATPRTDRFDPRCGRDEGKDDALTSWLGIVTISGPDYERLLDHARQLERELAERTDSLVETAAHASKLMDERDSMKVAQSSTTSRKRLEELYGLIRDGLGQTFPSIDDTSCDCLLGYLDELYAAISTKSATASASADHPTLPEAVGYMVRGEIAWETGRKPENGALVYAYKRDRSAIQGEQHG